MVRKGFWSTTGLLILTGIFLLLLVIIIIIAFAVVPLLVPNIIKNQVSLKEGTDQWERFVNIPVPFDIHLYFYEVLNADEVKINGSLPIVREVGPYVYTEWITRTILEQSDSEDTVTYIQTRNITFNQEKSGNLSESDVLIIVNPPMVVVAQLTSTIEQLALVGCLDKIFPEKFNKLFIEVDVKSIVLEGYTFASDDIDYGPACSVVRELVIGKASIIKNIDVLRNTDGSVSGLSFAFLQFKIREPDHVYVVKRGRDDVSELGSIVRWNETDKLHMWGRMESINNDTCKKIRGTDATIYPPNVSKDDYFEIFSTDICRVVAVTYNGTDTYKGIEGYRFGVTDKVLKSATENPEHDCYCVQKILNGGGEPSCFLDGIVDIMPCFNAPVLLSFPRFLYADIYREGVIGMEAPDLSIHQTYVLLEPNTGTPLGGHKRVQLNLVLRPVEYIPETKNLPGTVLPILWLDEGVALTQDLVDELNSKYFNSLKIVDGVKYGLIALMAAGTCVSGVIYLRKRHTSRKSR